MGKWKEIAFRNKSINNAIRVHLESTDDIRFTDNDFLITPLGKRKIGCKLLDSLKNSHFVTVRHDGGKGKQFVSRIAIRADDPLSTY